MATLASRCATIELLVLDVDGVLSDGSIIFAGADVEAKAFHSRDGSGLKLWREAGKRVAIISGRSSPAVTRRAAELGIDIVVLAATDKLAALQSIWTETGLLPEQTAGMGDDLSDLPVLCNIGLALAVADACSDVRQAAHYITQALGGRGAVREAIELVLRCQDKWQPVVDQLKR